MDEQYIQQNILFSQWNSSDSTLDVPVGYNTSRLTWATDVVGEVGELSQHDRSVLGRSWVVTELWDPTPPLALSLF